MHKWYVIHVLSSHEKKVKKTIEEQLIASPLKEQIVDILLPTENVSEVKRGEQRVMEKRIWPGYLLVKMDLNDDTWMFIKNTAGVIDFLGGGKPTAMSDEEIQQIIKDLEDKKQKVTLKHKFAIGDHVKIIDGVFVNFMGTVTEVSHEKGRLSALVSIFGRETRVDDLEFWQVEEAVEG